MRLATTHERNGPDVATHPSLGVLFCSLFCALFWTALLAAAGVVLGQPVSARLLLVMGSAVAGFLGTTLPLVIAAR